MTPTPPRHAAVIDIGKTNAKVALVDMGTFAEVAVRTLPNAVLRSGPYPHYDIDGIWSFVLDALRDLNREHAIDAITATTHGAACALLDAAGDLALPVLDYEHDGPDTLAAEYDAVRPLFAESGSPRLPGGLNLGAQLFWQQRRFPEAFARAAAILTYPQFWTFRLSGVAANEITSLGAHSDLWNPAAADYSSLVDRLGWRGLFAPLRQASDCLGVIRPEIAAQTGLRADVRVHCGIHDSNASLLPHLLTRPLPFAVVSTGTWVIAMAIGGAPVDLDPARDTLINIDARGEAVPSARFMGGREHAMLTEGAAVRCTEADIAAVLAGQHMLLPAIQAGSGPFPDRKAEWHGDAGVSPGQRQAAISFYLALMTSVCLELIGADGPIVTEGPFARNEAYLGMLAAATGRTIIPNTSRGTGTSVGAALLMAAGMAPPALEAVCITNDAPEWRTYARNWRSAADVDRHEAEASIAAVKHRAFYPGP
jgi:sugar (pentulose or hexulose) kinase